MQIKERLKVLFSLSLLKINDNLNKNQRNCLNEEDIACYFDNKMSTKERSHFFTELMQCPKSYSLWISMVETLGYVNAEQIKPVMLAKPEVSFSTLLIKWLSTHKAVFTGAFATTFLFSLVINFSSLSFSELSIDKQIVKVWQNDEVLNLAYLDVSKLKAKGINKSAFNVMPFAEKIAFSSGFKQGLINMSHISENINSNNNTLSFLNSLPNNPLSCSNQVCIDETQLNQQLGIWSSFVLQQCQHNSQNNLNYWKQQQIVVEHFIQEYKELSLSNTLISRVTNIGNDLQVLAQSKQNQYNQMVACNSIKQLALYSIQGL